MQGSNQEIGPDTAERLMRQAGYAPLAADDLLARIVDHTFWGDFLGGFRYVSWCDAQGRIEGTNNRGSYNTGHWRIAPDTGLFAVEFDQNWVPAVLSAYDANGVLHFFDRLTGMWHMNIRRIVSGRQIADFKTLPGSLLPDE